MHPRRSVSTLGFVIVLANNGASAGMIATRSEIIPVSIVIIEDSLVSLQRDGVFPVFAKPSGAYLIDTTTFEPVSSRYFISRSRIQLGYSSTFPEKPTSPLAIPLPASIWLFWSALAGLVVITRKRITRKWYKNYTS